MEIIAIGSSLQKVHGNCLNESFAQNFKCIISARFTESTFEDFQLLIGGLIVIESIKSKEQFILRGQFVPVENEKSLLFIGTPLVTDQFSLSKHHLSESDFPIHDSIVDTLQILNATSLVQKEMNVFVKELIKERDLLIRNNENRIEEKYRRIIEDLKFGLLEVDLNENITKVYPAFCDLVGYTKEELLGENARILIVNEEDNSSFDIQNDMRKEGKTSVYETKIKTKSGENKWVIISGAPIYNEYNEVIGSIGIHVDISNQKKMEEALIDATEKAQTSVKSKELFLANMSHEIRTPMNVIIGMAELLNESRLTEMQQKYLNAICHSSENLLTLINSILDYSKIEANQLTIENLDIDFYVFFENLKLSFLPYAQEKGINFKMNVLKGVCDNLVGDRHKINQVLVNLINNAIKFTDVGAVIVNCSVAASTKSYQMLKFEVIDTGIGIAKNNLEMVFQTFKQEDSSIARKYGGTGLGLSICKGIIHSLGGEITVESEKNKGSTFSFCLKFKRKLTKGNIVEPIIKAEPRMFNEVKILIAEDNQLNQMLIKAILDKESIQYDLAENGVQVLEKLKSAHFDLILMDIQMPIMDGINATIEIRNQLKSSIPIIALTANASVTDELKYKEVGMNDHLSKPFKREDLFNKIKKQLI
jgi:PAS domain S-box-containing protein